jgi:hypothetical protein
MPPPSIVQPEAKWDKTIYNFGALLTIGIGFRNILNFVSMILPGFWYGSLPEKYTFPDGLYQSTSSHSPSDQATEYTPNKNAEMCTWIGKGFGAFGGFLGLKRLLDILYLVAYGIWFGAAPSFFNLVDSPIRAELGEPISYIHWTGNLLGGLGGAIFGIQFLVLCIPTLIKGFWYGSAPEYFHLEEGFLSKPCNSNSRSSPNSVWINPWVGYIFGFCGCVVGLRAVINILTMIPRVAWWGFFQFDLKDGICGPAEQCIRSKTARILGFIFGVIVGLRTWIDIAYIILQAMWWGGAPSFFRIKGSPVHQFIKSDKTPSKLITNLGWIFGCGIGLRSISLMICHIPFGTPLLSLLK